MHSINAILQTIKLSLKNIKSNKMRTFLTTLGVIIGVGSIIAMVTIMNCNAEQSKKLLLELGLNSIDVTINGSAYKSALNREDLRQIEQLQDVAGVIPKININGNCVVNGRFQNEVTINGLNEYQYIATPNKIVMGRPISRSDVDNEAYVCVVDERFRNKMFGGNNPVGATMTICGMRYEVIGVEKTDIYFAPENGAVSIPYTTAQKQQGNSGITSLKVYATDMAKTESVKTQLKQLFNRTFKNKKSYSIMAMNTMIENWNAQEKKQAQQTGGIAAISLFVGGIGIMNMMLVSVTERTREIGLRKSLGATPIRIQLQFMLESVVLSLMGGITGGVIGNAVAFLWTKYLMGIPFRMYWGTVLLAVGFSAAVGIIFGWAPATKASKLNPIDALRSE